MIALVGKVAATETFLESPNDESFTELFYVDAPTSVLLPLAGLRVGLSEDLSQEVMLIVYRKAAQLRDRTRFLPGYYNCTSTRFTWHHRMQSPEEITMT